METDDGQVTYTQIHHNESITPEIEDRTLYSTVVLFSENGEMSNTVRDSGGTEAIDAATTITRPKAYSRMVRDVEGAVVEESSDEQHQELAPFGAAQMMMHDPNVNSVAPPWYHGSISPDVVPEFLTDAEPGTFLVRQEADMVFELVVMEKDGIMGHTFIRQNRKYMFVAGRQKDIPPMSTIRKLIDSIRVPMGKKWPRPLEHFIPRLKATPKSIQDEISHADAVRGYSLSVPIPTQTKNTKSTTRDPSDFGSDNVGIMHMLQAIWSTVFPDSLNRIDAEQSRKIMMRSKLPMEKLSEIWEMVDSENTGMLTYTQLGFILVLISQAQQNLPYNMDIDVVGKVKPPEMEKASSPTKAKPGKHHTYVNDVVGKVKPPAPEMEKASLPTKVKPEKPHAYVNDDYNLSSPESSNQSSHSNSNQITNKSSDMIKSNLYDQPHTPPEVSQSPNDQNVTPQLRSSNGSGAEGEERPRSAYMSVVLSTPEEPKKPDKLPMDEQLWWAGATSKETVDKLVVAGTTGDFLVRNSSKGDGLVLVIHQNGKVINFPILVKPNGFCQLGVVKMDSVVELIEALHVIPLTSPIDSKPIRLLRAINPTATSIYEEIDVGGTSNSQTSEYVEFSPDGIQLKLCDDKKGSRFSFLWGGKRAKRATSGNVGSRDQSQANTKGAKDVAPKLPTRPPPTKSPTKDMNSPASAPQRPRPVLSFDMPGESGTDPLMSLGGFGGETETDEVPPATASNTRPEYAPMSPIAKTDDIGGADFHKVLENVMLTRPEWCRPNMGRIDMENYLYERGPGAFILRTSTTLADCWALSIQRENGKIWNTRIKEVPDGYVVSKSDVVYKSLEIFLARVMLSEALRDKIGFPNAPILPATGGSKESDEFSGLRALMKCLEQVV